MLANRPTRQPRRSASLVIACAVALVIVALLAAVALPRDHAASPTATMANVAAVERTTTAVPPPAATTQPGREINLDLGPLITATPTIARPTATPTPGPTRAPGPPVPGKEELIANGGFETVDGSWYTEQSAGITSGDAHGGGGALVLGPGAGYADQRLPVEAGATYQVTVWSKLTAANDTGQIAIRYEDAAFAAIKTITPVLQTIGGGDWSQTTFTFTAPPGAVRAVLSFWHPPGAGYLLIDDVSTRQLVPS